MHSRRIDNAVIDNRAAFYSCPKETFHTVGNTYRIRDWTDGTLFLTKLYDHIFISCGEKLERQLRSAGTFITADYLLRTYPGLKPEDRFPHYVYRKDKAPSHPLASGYEMRRMNPSHHPPLQEFLDLCTPEDIDEALIDLDDPDKVIRLIYRGDEPVAYAGYRLWDNGLGDVGILTRPEHRLKGIGSAAVAAVTQDCLAGGDIPFYRLSRSNRGSLAIAANLGYSPVWESEKYQIPLSP